MTRKNVTILQGLAVGAAAALSLAACGGGSSGTAKSSDSGGNAGSGSSKQPIVIGAVAAESGSYGAYGLADIKGMQAEVNLINNQGGVDGRKLKLVAIDDQSDPSKAVSGVQKLLSQTPKPLMIHCGAISVDCAAILPYTGRTKTITMTPAATPAFENPSKNPYNFVIFVGSDLQVGGTAALMKSAGPNPAGIISSSDTGGKNIAEAMQKGLPKSGIKIAKTEYVAPDATTFTPALQALRSAGVKTLFAQMESPTSFVTLMDNIQSLGWKDVKVVAGTTAVAQTVLTKIPSAVNDQFVALGTHAVVRTGNDLSSLPATEQKFLEEFKQIKAPTNFMVGSIDGADEVALTAWAAKKAGSAGSSKVYNVLNHLGKNTHLPSDLLMEVPHPDWSPTNHGLKGADLSHYWASVKPSKPIEGIYRGKTLDLSGS
jgi:branched-chain amino acid transport system substrate-binding protein